MEDEVTRRAAEGSDTASASASKLLEAGERSLFKLASERKRALS